MNNQSKFSLADVLTLLAAFVFGFVCFLSTNFYTLGDITQSVVLAAIASVVLFVTAFSAKQLKRTSRNFKTCFIWEIISLVLFTGLTVFFACSPFPHYFTVSEQKADIQGKLAMSITQAENMFAEYEKYAGNRESLYTNKLRSVAAAKSINPSEYTEYGFEKNGIADSKQIETKMFMLHAELFPTNYSDTVNNNGIKEAATIWLSKAKNTIFDWKPIGIVNVVTEVEKNSNDWLNKLVKLSVYRGKGEQIEDFSYDLSFENVKEHFAASGKPVLLSIGLSLAAYLLMLLSYFITERSTKSSIGRKTRDNAGFDVEL
jgi:energy-coupling factor transporter transmembrane protein EcfT